MKQQTDLRNDKLKSFGYTQKMVHFYALFSIYGKLQQINTNDKIAS